MYDKKFMYLLVEKMRSWNSSILDNTRKSSFD